MDVGVGGPREDRGDAALDEGLGEGTGGGVDSIRGSKVECPAATKSIVDCSLSRASMSVVYDLITFFLVASGLDLVVV